MTPLKMWDFDSLDLMTAFLLDSSMRLVGHEVKDFLAMKTPRKVQELLKFKISHKKCEHTILHCKS